MSDTVKFVDEHWDVIDRHSLRTALEVTIPEHTVNLSAARSVRHLRHLECVQEFRELTAMQWRWRRKVNRRLKQESTA
jgi:hypothetical protein